MNLLFSMSLAGSLALLVYLIIRPAATRYLPASWRYRLLKIILLIFLLPYQYFKYLYMEVWNTLFAGYKAQKDFSFSVNPDRTVFVDCEGNAHFENRTVLLIVLTLWVLISLMYMLYHVISYIQCTRNLQQITESSAFSTAGAALHTPGKSSHAGVLVSTSRQITVPFTIGLLHPRILLPASLSDQTTQQMVLSHELEHVRNHDNVIRLLCLLALLLHWYNPLIYLLYWELFNVGEQVCDAAAVRDRSAQEIETYQLLILEMSKEKPRKLAFLSSPLSGHFKTMKERILAMNKPSVSANKTRIASLFLALVILAISPISVWAYSAPKTFKDAEADIHLHADEICFTSSPAACSEDLPCAECLTDQAVFVDAEGNSFTVSDANSQITRALCFHNWVDGYVYRHQKNSGGGCTVYVYSAQACSYCNNVRNVVYKNKITYDICPHT